MNGRQAAPLGRRHTMLGVTAMALASASPGSAVTAQAQTAPSAFTNSLGMEFLRIPAGNFLMGSPDSDREAPSMERPQHRVTISRPFYIGRFELTQAQWIALIGSSPFDRDRSNPYYNLPGMAARITKPDHPANISWHDAQEFIARLNEKEGGPAYRLPTEAEWEYAARAGSQTRYSFGDNTADLDGYAWYGGNFATGGSHPVGQKLPNAWGLYDVHGNVWEWVQDWFDQAYYARSPTIDPQGPETGTRRVVRGGSWHNTGDGWRSAARRDYVPDYRGISIGIRLVRNAA